MYAKGRRLAALIPPPKLNLTRYHGVFAPNHELREQITKSSKRRLDCHSVRRHNQHSYRLTWAERLRRVFNIDIETCEKCGGQIKIIATIKDSVVIKKILEHIAHQESGIPVAYQLPWPHSPPGEFRGQFT